MRNFSFSPGLDIYSTTDIYYRTLNILLQHHYFYINILY